MAATHSIIAEKLLMAEAKSHPQTTSSAVDPSGAPRAVGDFHVNTATQVLWVATASNTWCVCSTSHGFPRVTVTSSTYTASEHDTWIGVNNAGTVSITLPQISSISNAQNQMRLSICDEGGQAGTYPISIVAATGDKIVGLDVIQITSDFGSFALVSTTAVDPNQWLIGVAH